ncbi:MAG: hypothetical protein AB8B69_12575 [Chitinophagales bacterium]
MYLVLKEMKEWIDFLFNTSSTYADEVEVKDSKYFEHFYTWLIKRRHLFEEHSLSKYLEPIASISIRIIAAKRLYDMNSDGNSLFSKISSFASQGGLIALMPEFAKQRKMLDGLIDIFAAELRDDLAKNKVELVFNSLQKDMKYCENTQTVNGFYSIKKRYNELKFQQMRGIISQENYFLEMNKISYAILSFI